jgi:hypothetical protein
MTNYTNSSFLVAFMWMLTIGLSIGTGILAWNWIEPDNFFMVLLFLAAWAVLSRLSHFIVFGLLMVVFEN